MLTTDAATSVMSSDEPFTQVLPSARKSAVGRANRRRLVLLEAKNATAATAASACPNAVASAAPAMPQPSTAMNR